MKYILVAALVSLIFLVVYSRVRPYLRLARKVLSILNGSAPATSQDVQHEHRLVRCTGCGTWIPESKAVKLSAGRAIYCSRDCLEKSAVKKERKLAG